MAAHMADSAAALLSMPTSSSSGGGIRSPVFFPSSSSSSSPLLGLLLGDAVDWSRTFVGEAWRSWTVVRVAVVAPLLRIWIVLCLMMTLMILVEKLAFGAVALGVKLFRLKPERRYTWEPITRRKEDDLEAAAIDLDFPMVLVQIPMFNEKEVYKLSIGAACCLDWPTERLIIQVLDDSTDVTVKELVEQECLKWKAKGKNIHYVVRDNRKGYKAGALKEGMTHEYVRKCHFVAMFDADFQPDPDFLARTMPFLVHNPEIALVQARWKFVNADECILTRIQEMSLDYHFKVEQEAGSSTFAFFGFNGTAGVWRIAALEQAGGWKDRTTVEDMDLAVRAGLHGWKFVYVGDIKVKNELPSTFKAYRYQQHRWSCGPANLFRKMALEIILNKKVSLWKKLYLIYSFFFVGKIVAHSVTFIFYCVVIPLSVLVPEAEVPMWGAVYVPTMITLCKSVGTPTSFHLLVFWILFENVMSLHRIKAAMTGLMESQRVNEWVVTEKLGDALKIKLMGKEPKNHINGEVKITIKEKRLQKRFWHRFHYSELCVALFLTISGVYDVLHERKGYFVYLFLQALAFFIAGIDYVGTTVPT